MPKLNVPQAEFLALDRKFKAFVSGFGGGKTWAGSAGLCMHAWERPRINAGYFAPTYPQIRDIFYPTIEEVAHDWGLTAKIHETNKEVALYGGGGYRTTILCRSMDKPGSIVGFKIGHAMVDELDVMERVKAASAWRKIIARMRYNVDGLRNGIDVTTTPEGFKFTYEQFVKALRDQPALRSMYGLVQASTYDNERNLPADYIPSLRASYPPQLIDAYIRGQFVNLASGSVYPDFDRRLNHTNATIERGEVLHVGMDFNVQNLHAVVNVIRDGRPLSVAEVVKVRDTPAVARILRERFPGHTIIVYPDAAGAATSTKNASESDHAILRQANFQIEVRGVNPPIRDRVNAVNAMICNAQGERRWLVNTDTCPTLTECLEQQAYDASGEPDKKSGFDHANDAQGYFLANRWPILTRQVERVQVVGR